MPLIIGTNSIKDTGFNVANSLRFNEGSSDSLEYTQSTPTNGKKFTISVWTKFMEHPLGNGQEIIAGGTDGSNETFLRYNNQEKIQFRHEHSSDTNWHVQTNKILRDPSAWYHIVTAVDTTQGTASNRIKLYINGVQETSFATENYPAQNEETFLNKASATVKIGQQAYANSAWFSGYMAEFCFIDGQQLAPTSFGEFDEDSGIWKPKSVSALTFGTNGFYLDFENSGSLGNDKSGNGNNFTVNNLTSVDQSTDTCTNNFATWNYLNQISSVAYSEGNLKFTNSSSTNRLAFPTFAMTKGKWYCEMKVTEHNNSYTHIGLRNIGSYTLTNAYVNDPTNEKVSYLNDGRVYIHGGTETSSLPTYTSGDIIGMACDMDNGYLYYHKNGTYINSGNTASGSSGTGGFDIYNHGSIDYCFAVSNSDGGTDPVIEANFGSPPYAISSGNTDGNGYGNFEFAVPSGYYALNTKNLAEYG